MTKLPTSNGISKARPAEVLAKSGVKSGRAGDALPEDVANAVVSAGGKFATTAQLIKTAAEGRGAVQGKSAVKDDADEVAAQSDDGEQSYANAPVAMADAGVMQVAAMYAAATAQADAGQSDAGDNEGVSAPLIIGGVLLAGGAIALAAGGGGGGGQDNRAPTFSSGATASIAENAAASTVVYDANATDPDSGNTLTYSLSGTDAAAFNINATTGEVTLKASADFEAKASYAITVVATDNGSPAQSVSQNIAVTVTNVNETPTITSAATASVAENAGIATIVYDAAATDPDAGSTLTYSLAGADAAAFDINATTGEVTLKAPADFEAKSSYAISVVAADNGNPALTTSKDVVVSVTNVNEAPAITSGAAASVVDNAAAGSVVYTTVATDPDAGDSLVYELSGPDADLFDISSTGVVTLKQAANYEASADHSYSFSVTAIDAGELSATQAVTVTIENAVDVLSLDQGAFGDTFQLDAADGNDPANVLDVDFRLDETPAESDVEIVNFGANDYINFLEADPDDYSYQADGTDLVLTYLPAGGDLSTITLVDVLEPGAIVNDAASADAALDAALGAGDYFVGTALEATIDLDIAAGPQNAAGKSVTFTDDGSVESAAIIQNFRSDDVIAFTNAGDGGDVLYQATFDDPNDLQIDYIDASGNLSSVVLDNVLNGDIVFDFDTASAALGRADFITFA